MGRILIRGLVTLIALALGGVALLGSGLLGRHEAPGEITPTPRPHAFTEALRAGQAGAARALGAADGKQIVFGDLHVHTTFSSDAFLFSLPILGGEGAHPPADACDFARYCSALDFWSMNDHAEALTPRHWRETVESVRQCNAAAGDPSNPDVVAFLGWEWTQVGARPEEHYGHKNVVLAHTDDARIPARPIAARREGDERAGPGLLTRAAFALGLRDRRGLDLTRYYAERAARQRCPEDVPVRELPTDCLESAATPGALFAKLDEWGHEALVIPHGTAWGWTAPVGSGWDLQLRPEQDDPRRQPLVEIFSGHGNSEEYRAWRWVGAGGQCPEPSAGYLPACWRAGEIIAERCAAAGESPAECERRAAEARANHLAAGKSGPLTVPGASAQDWLDAGQCRDCFLPAFDLRPRMSVQYQLARRSFASPDAEGRPFAQRMGFIGSSDIHSARPGTGYKEFARAAMTDGRGPIRPINLPGLGRPAKEPQARSTPVVDPPTGFAARDSERVASYLYTGGLVAAHVPSRARGDVFAALQQREVYATSGDRILLWFDLLNPPGGDRAPMGSEHVLDAAPRFEVRAVGAYHQKPGCPEHVARALDAERLERLCHGECYHPGDTRKWIERIEIVRIRPQLRDDEAIETLIEDPWRVLPCSPDPAGCRVGFEDDEFLGAGREAIYYARAIQEPTPTVNAGGVRCERDDAGQCLRSSPCYGDWRSQADDDCLVAAGERAWSSPIWVEPARQMAER